MRNPNRNSTAWNIRHRWHYTCPLCSSTIRALGVTSQGTHQVKVDDENCGRQGAEMDVQVFQCLLNVKSKNTRPKVGLHSEQTNFVALFQGGSGLCSNSPASAKPIGQETRQLKQGVQEWVLDQYFVGQYPVMLLLMV